MYAQIAVFWIESFSIANIHHICIKWIVKMQFLLDLSFISSYYFVHSFLLLSLPLYHNKFTYICTMCNAHSVLAFAIFLNCKRCSCRPAFNFEQICIPLFWFKWKQTEPNQMKRFSFFQIIVLYSNILRRNSILIAITNQKWEETEGDNKKKNYNGLSSFSFCSANELTWTRQNKMNALMVFIFLLFSLIFISVIW